MAHFCIAPLPDKAPCFNIWMDINIYSGPIPNLCRFFVSCRQRTKRPISAKEIVSNISPRVLCPYRTKLCGMTYNGSIHSARSARVGIKPPRGIRNVEIETEMGGFIRAAGNIDVEICSEKDKIPVSDKTNVWGFVNNSRIKVFDFKVGIFILTMVIK